MKVTIKFIAEAVFDVGIDSKERVLKQLEASSTARTAYSLMLAYHNEPSFIIPNDKRLLDSTDLGGYPTIEFIDNVNNVLYDNGQKPED